MSLLKILTILFPIFHRTKPIEKQIIPSVFIIIANLPLEIKFFQVYFIKKINRLRKKIKDTNRCIEK